MPISIIRPLILSAALGLTAAALPATVNANSAGTIQNQAATLESHFMPRPSKRTRLDYEAWDFILGETVLYMGPSTRTRGPRIPPRLGTRQVTSHTSPYMLEGNKVMYSRFTDEVKSGMKSYAEELVELGNRLNIPSLSKNEQLAYWINLHNAVLITTVSENYPPPHRRPSRIKPIKGSSATLHDAKLITIDNYALSLRDIREKIVFPNWRNKDVPYAFHLGNLGSPSMANFAYSAPILEAQMKSNAEEFVNSLRGYNNGKLSSYIRDVAPWYYPNLDQDLDVYFRNRMRPEVYKKFRSDGIKRIDRAELTLADMTGGIGVSKSISQLESAVTQFSIGTNVDRFLERRATKIQNLRRLEWFKNATVTIEDTPTEDEPPSDE